MRSGISLRENFDGEGLRRLARQTKDAAQVRRLLALASIYDGGSRSNAARLGNVTLQIVRDWVIRFNERGPQGFVNGKAPGQQSRLNDQQRAALAQAVERGPTPYLDGVVRWRRTRSAYIFGAICPKLGKAAALVMPWCDTHAMTQHLAEIGRHVDEDAHAVLIMDQAGWHMSNNLVVPENITILPLPPKSLELNPVENLWLFIRENWLSNRIFKSYEDIVAHCCDSWRKLESQPWRIMSIGRREWANGF